MSARAAGYFEMHRDDMPETACWLTDRAQCLPHFHSSVELLYILSGGVSAMIDGHPCEAGPNQLLISSAYAVHAYHEDRKDLQCMIIIVPLAFVPSMHKKLENAAFSSILCDVAEASPLASVLQMMLSGWPAFNAETRKGFSYALLGLLCARVGLDEKIRDRGSGMIEEVLTYLQSHYADPISPATLARLFGYSKSRFSHLFNQRLGCSVGAYVNALRCRAAAQRMAESDESMLDLSASVGFDCLRTFYRAFKSCYGLTPTQYARRPGEE